MRAWCRTIVMVSVLALPLVTHAQARNLDPSTRALLADPALATEGARLGELIASIDPSALPQALLIEKVREGLAKRVPAARIVQAVTVLRDRLLVVDRLLEASARTPATARSAAAIALVDALNAGLSEAELATVLRALGGAARELSVVREVAITMAELAERGFGGSAVVNATTWAWRQGGVASLPGVIAAAVQVGTQVSSRDAALQERVQQLHAAPGLSRAPGQQDGTRESGPPHDDGFGKAAQRGRGLAKGHNR